MGWVLLVAISMLSCSESNNRLLKWQGVGVVNEQACYPTKPVPSGARVRIPALSIYFCDEFFFFIDNLLFLLAAQLLSLETIYLIAMY